MFISRAEYEAIWRKFEIMQEWHANLRSIVDVMRVDFTNIKNRLDVIDKLKECPVCKVKPTVSTIENFMRIGLIAYRTNCPKCDTTTIADSIPEAISKWNEHVESYNAFKKVEVNNKKK